MSEHLPKYIEPLRLARNEADFAGDIPLSDMPRLVGQLLSNEGSAEIDLHFGMDERGFAVISGQVRASVILQCQRCLEAMTVQLNSEINVGLVRKKTDEGLLPAEMDAMQIENDDPLVLSEFIEDELLLSLPIVARHQEGEACALKNEYQEGDEAPKRPNPFAVLVSLKKNH